MEPNTEGNLLEIMDLARTLRQEQLFIQQEQATFGQLSESMSENSSTITKLAYICAKQRQNLNDLITSRPESGPLVCCRRANNYDNVKFVDAKKAFDYEIAIAYEELFNHLYRSPYLLAVSLATADRIPEITTPHITSVVHTISTGLYGNAINTKDVEMILKLLRELIEIQIVVSDNPKRLLRANSSVFARLYHRLNESMFSAKIFLTAALYQPLMEVLVDSDTILDVDLNKVVENFSSKERLRRFGAENSPDFQHNIEKFHLESISKLQTLAKSFINSLTNSWSLFPSTLRWLVQTMSHSLKQAHFGDKIINEIISDMIFTHFICPAIVSPDICGIIDAPISEAVRFNLIQIGQIIQLLALPRDEEIDNKYAELHSKFEVNLITNLIDLLLVSQTGEDVVATVLSQQSDFERSHMLSTQTEISYFVEFFRILMASDDYEIPEPDRNKLKKVFKHLPEISLETNGQADAAASHSSTNGTAEHTMERAKQGFIRVGKVTKSKIAKSMSFSTNGGGHAAADTNNINGGVLLPNGNITNSNGSNNCLEPDAITTTKTDVAAHHSSPVRSFAPTDSSESEPILVFSIYTGDEHKLQPLTEEEVLKMNSIGQEIVVNGDSILVNTADSCNLENTIDKSSVTNDGYDGLDGMSDVLRPLHGKTTRFSLSHDDASIGNSDNLEAVSEAPSNHSVTSSLELEENDQNDNLSDMVSANVSGRGTPNISGRDTPSSQVTDGESVHNALPTPQMQKLLSKARSEIEDKFCKFELKKFEGDETVSIISDTWSTDVLASDSENLDANERERDRNFSTPLIPSAVVLPGDNNFDVLGVSVVVGRSGYLDASDQRSESNWSTDVLASDSEKLAEVDTDDNLSITAKSDITDIEGRSEQERDMLAAAISAAPARNYRSNASAIVAGGAVGGDGGDHGSGGSSNGNGSDRSQEDSAFFDAINLYDEAAAAAGGPNGEDLSSAASLHHYHGLSSLARSSVRTTNQYNGENSFQQNYKSSYHESKEAFLATPRMRRQTSAESSISNQSLNEEGASSLPPKAQHHYHHHKGANKKKKQHSFLHPSKTDNKDLIDFSDFGEEERVKSSLPSKKSHSPSTAHSAVLDLFVDESPSAVQCRSVSNEQRSVGEDGRRNGMMAMKPGSNSIASLRRHQSLNYENHEILVNTTIPKRMSAVPNLKQSNSNIGLSQTDDDKHQEQQQLQEQAEELMLCAKTAQLHLDDSIPDASNDIFENGAVSSNMTTVNSASSSVQQKTKSTGAIPKSISFDASADKSSDHLDTHASSSRSRNLHLTAGSTAITPNSGIFNKLKHGFFKNRKAHKSHRHNSTAATGAGGGDADFANSSRSVSFSTTSADVSLDLLTANVVSRNGPVGYGDISYDILAKYRRKVSTSSEATNSDSTGCNGMLAVGGLRPNTDLEANRISNTSLLHDKAMAFNIIKKKIRTVLSKTDLHTGDFRHTTYSQASPLLTYLQIQLAQAINLQNFHQISYVSEAIRCISTLDTNQHSQLLEELQADIQKRQNYLQYLMRYRQNLLLIMENIEQFEQRLRSDSTNCNRYLMAECVRLFIEKRQEKITDFQEQFAALTVSDDKIDLIEEFIENLMEELVSSAGILFGMPEWQALEARISIERTLLQRMYQQVMFPNEDADLSRDTVLSEHIRKLQRIIRPSHPALRIPQEFLSEAPWTFAQQQLSYITAYKTPREKLQCVKRCIASLMSLLHMSSGRSASADDLLPVLIYIVIMANPPYLLSTVEYITCFIGEKLDGEDQFHWTLFTSVVKFIKTMDYLD